MANSVYLKHTPLILAVDDDQVTLAIIKEALSTDFNVMTAQNAKMMFRYLEELEPALILLDVNMPNMNGYEAITILKSNITTRDIPVLFLTSMTDVENEIKGLRLGAEDYIKKPFTRELLLARVNLHIHLAEQREKLRHQSDHLCEQASEIECLNAELQLYNDELSQKVFNKTQEIRDIQKALFQTMATLVEKRDDETGGHIDRTSKLVGMLYDAMLRENVYANTLRKWDRNFFISSATLHDIGKIAISDLILLKPAKLTPGEFEVMKTHAQAGVEIIEQVRDMLDFDSEFLDHAIAFAGYHHERWDGKGYPYGVAGEEIPLQGRMLSIVDVYDALISKRPYKQPFSHEKALEIISLDRDIRFEPQVTDVFLNMF